MVRRVEGEIKVKHSPISGGYSVDLDYRQNRVLNNLYVCMYVCMYVCVGTVLILITGSTVC
jgi:hypothetical protein